MYYNVGNFLFCNFRIPKTQPTQNCSKMISYLRLWDQCCMWSECPSFAFGAGITCDPSALALPLGLIKCSPSVLVLPFKLMKHVVYVFYALPGRIVEPNPLLFFTILRGGWKGQGHIL